MAHVTMMLPPRGRLPAEILDELRELGQRFGVEEVLPGLEEFLGGIETCQGSFEPFRDPSDFAGALERGPLLIDIRCGCGRIRMEESSPTSTDPLPKTGGEGKSMLLILDERNVLPRLLLLGLRRYGFEGIHERRIERAVAHLSQTDLCLAGELSCASWKALQASLRTHPRRIPLLLLSEAEGQGNLDQAVERLDSPTDLDAFGRKIVEIAKRIAPALLEQPGSGKRNPSIQTTGTIEGNMAEIFGACHILHLSGTLHLSQNGAIKTVFFREGVPVLAHSSDETERIGSLLVREEKISEHQLHEALKAQEKSRKRIGAIFVDQGYLDETERKLALQLQTELICLSLFAWETGTFLLSLEDRSFAEGEL
ncbi:MAG: hypothetical protein D6795_11650, partial [Deltaproteobacteria bacterium]